MRCTRFACFHTLPVFVVRGDAHRSVGLAPTKAKHLIALSQMLLDRFGGQVPQTFEGLMSLPGVGEPCCVFFACRHQRNSILPVHILSHRRYL